MQWKIKDFAQFFGGFQTRQGVKTQSDGGYFLVQIRDFGNSRTWLDPSNFAKVSPKGINPDSCLRPGDVLFLAKGARNFAYAIPESLPSPLLAGSYFFIVRPNKSVFPPYLSWFLNQEPARRHFVQNATTGAHMPVVRRDDLENLKVPIPSLATQRKIVEFATLANQQRKLLAELAEKKDTLATAACLRAANQSNDPNS